MLITARLTDVDLKGVVAMGKVTSNSGKLDSFSHTIRSLPLYAWNPETGRSDYPFGEDGTL